MMTTTTPPPNVIAARQQAIGTDYYALGYLALCIASYSDAGGTEEEIKAAIAANVPSLGQIGNVPGKWTLDWGPAITTSILSWKANLLFAASYRDPSTDLPIFSAVVIRGTDISAGFLGVLKQLHEDLEPGCQLVWPDGSGGCASEQQSSSSTQYIARGTFHGFQSLLALQGLNQSTQQTQTLGDFLAAFVPAYSTSSAPLPLIVTGHSLGGCQTSPVARWIHSQSWIDSGVVVVPHSFAAPTAGNEAFANAYLQELPNARRWYNSYDIVPMAFDQLATMDDLWFVSPYACGVKPSSLERAALLLLKTDVGNLQYAHEGGGSARLLNGVCGSSTTTVSGTTDGWGAQLEYQHFPPCGYWHLMVNQYSSTLGALAYPPWVTPAPQCSSSS